MARTTIRVFKDWIVPVAASAICSAAAGLALSWPAM